MQAKIACFGNKFVKPPQLRGIIEINLPPRTGVGGVIEMDFLGLLRQWIIDINCQGF